ncbi:MAG: FAD-dependent oxidoreductase, partial [Fibrobacterales bacterium]
DRGQITVSPHFETSQKHIYAIGDVAPGMMLAHKAEYEGILVAQHIAGKTIDTRIPEIPGVIYTHPEAASIGLTEQSLKKSSSLYKKGVAQFRANGRARAVNEIEGFVKILAHEDGSVAGIHIVGAVASELIAEAGIIMKAGMTISDIAHTVHAHPTFSETLKEAAEACLNS